MISGNNRLSLAKVKEMDLVDYLATLGYFPDPKKSKDNDYWYKSPLREEEQTPSFQVNRRTGRWKDWGPLPGQIERGNIIDFAIQYYGCTVSEFLSKLRSGGSFNLVHVPGKILPKEQEAKITILSHFPLKSYPLLKYAEQRGIPHDILMSQCCEVNYEVNGKIFYAIGFKNDIGGFELRNAYVKNGSMPKGITTIDNGSKNVETFEGFFDFLSFLVMHRNTPEARHNFVILNSTSFFEGAREFMEKHEQIGMHLDHGKGGRSYTEYGLSLGSQYKDKSAQYKGFDDLNDWLVKSKKEPRQKLGPRL